MSSSKSMDLGMRSALAGAVFAGIWACSAAIDEPAAAVGPDPAPPFGEAPGSNRPQASAPAADGASSNSRDDIGFADGTSTGAGFDGNAACRGQVVGTEILPTVLHLVVDTSGSMNDDAPGPVPGSKWDVTRDALLAAVDRMPAATAVGVVFYPDTANNTAANTGNMQDSCFDRQTDVPLQVLAELGSAQRTQILSAFQGQKPSGATPTHDAYAYAVQDLNAAGLAGARFAVLITDGIPTFSLGCDSSNRGQNNAVDSAPLVVEAASSLALGVRTFVIGSPGSEGARENLSRMAEAGGTAVPGCSHTGPRYCHFDMTPAQDFAAALADALGQIAGLALGCSYAIPAPPDGAQLDPSKVNVSFQPLGAPEEVIRRSPGNTCSEGWQYSPDGKQVMLCGSACERVRDVDGNVTLQFGCATTIR